MSLIISIYFSIANSSTRSSISQPQPQQLESFPFDGTDLQTRFEIVILNDYKNMYMASGFENRASFSTIVFFFY